MKTYRRFLFTRSEIRGIIGLSASIIIIRLLVYSFPIVPVEVPPPATPPRVLPNDRQPSAGFDHSATPGKSGKTRDQTVNHAVSRPQTRKLAEPVMLEINGADTVALQALTGIGPSFAKRIVKYREMLGGFAFPERLLQFYGMDSARYRGFISEICLDTSLLRRIDINQDEFREMLRHPYLEYEHVKAICNFRERKGTINSPEELWNAGILPDSLQKKLIPYLKTH